MSKPNIVDPESPEDNELEYSSVDSFDDAAPEQDNSEQTEEEKLLAGKFKDVSELEKAYQNLEKEKSRQGNELGELRSKVDQLIPMVQQQANQQPQKETEEEVSEEDFWDNPQKAVQSQVKSALNEELEPIKQEFTQSKAEKAKNQLLEKQPDAFDVYQSGEFQNWIQSRPAYQKVLQEADQNYDAETAADIIDLYKKENNIQEKKTEEKEVSEAPTHDSESLKQASVESSKSQKSSSKKIYRRADIVDLMMNNPQRYEQLADEISAAYAEGRVK